MSDIRIDDDGFLVGDGEQERTEAENVLMREIKADTTTIISLMKGTQRLQRDALKAAQGVAKTKGNQSNSGNNGNVSPRVNLQHPNRANGANNQGQRVNLQHPNRPPINNGNGANGGQQRDTARPRVQQNRGGNAGSPTPQSESGENGRNGTARVNRQRDANGRFIGADNTDIGSESDNTQGRGNRDSRGRFVGGDGSAAERSAVSRITDSLKDLNSNLTLNADTDRIDPMVDAIKEASGIVAVGIDASKKVLSVSNTLIAKPAMALGRGIKGLFKPKTDTINSPVAWYKRIWRTLERGNRQDQTQHAQEQRRLDELVRGQGQRGSADSGLLLMLGLGLAGLLAAFKNIKIPSIDDIKEKLKALGTDNKSPVPVVKVPKVGGTIIQANPALKWLSETKVGKTISKFLKRLPFISSAIEAGAGGINAINIANDANLTEEQKQRRQSQNAGQTGGAIVGGLGGVTAGAALGAKLGLMTGNPIIAAVGGVVGGLVGGWLGTDAGRIVGDKIGGWADDLRKADIAGRISNAWTGFIEKITPSFSGLKESILDLVRPKANKPIDILKNAPTKSMSLGEKPVSIVGDVYANKESELYKNYQKWREADTDGKGVITFEDFKKSKYVKQNPNLLKQFEPDSVPKKQAKLENSKGNKSKQAAYNQVKPLIGEAAKRFNVSEKMLTGFAGQESGFMGGGLKNKDSTATGLFQFVEDTWADQIARSNQPEALPYKADAQAYLNDKQQGLSREKRREKYKTLLAARNDNKLNAVMGAQYSRYAIDALAKKGVFNPTIEEVYTYHHDGNTKAVAKARKGDADSQAHVKNLGSRLPDDIAYYKPNTPTNTVPTIKTAPVNAASSPSVQSVPSVQAQESPRRLDNTPTPIKVSMPKPLVGQNISDRGIAHIVTGGIGETV